MIFVSFVIFVCAPWAVQPSDVEWTAHGGDGNIRYSPLTQVDRSNVAQLKVAWTYDSNDAFKGSEMQSNPIVVGGVLYATTPTLKVVAVDAATGREIWKFDPSGGAAPGARFRHRGVVVYRDRVFVTYRNTLFALSTRDGQPIATFGANGRVDLREGLGRPAEKLTVTASTPGVVFEDLLIMGSTVPETLPSAPGDIRAFDVNTGKIRWSFHTIPHPGEPGYETWPPDAWQITGGANAWSGVAIDPKLAMVFAATGSASFDFYGANRKGDNLYADCVLALDARTGKHVWHFQALKHDVWDLDFPAAPNLVTVTRAGRKVDAVAQVTKTGFVFVLDRRTGKPLFPIENRPVPATRIDGEQLSRTQPVPVMPPPFARSGPTEAMLTRRTPEAHAAVLAQFRQLEGGTLYPAVAERDDHLPRRRRRRRMGRRGLRSADGAALRQLERDAVDRAADQERRHLAVQREVRDLPPDRSHRYRGGSDADRHRPAQDARPARSTSSATGPGRMPGYPDLGTKNTSDLVDFLITGKDKGADPALATEPTYVKYRSDGETLWRDPDGYPPLTPPWGTLNAIDLNAGTIRWKIPFGEYPELVAKGLRNTGSDNYGGPVVTASGLLFIGATNFDRKFHAYDKLTGKLLWETTLPAAGNATPAIYSLDGREYIVIVCGGGKNGAPSGSSIVAFALPR